MSRPAPPSRPPLAPRAGRAPHPATPAGCPRGHGAGTRPRRRRPTRAPLTPGHAAHSQHPARRGRRPSARSSAPPRALAPPRTHGPAFQRPGAGALPATERPTLAPGASAAVSARAPSLLLPLLPQTSASSVIFPNPAG